MTLAVASEKRLQLVPNWNGMTMPETTPMPKATEKILIQKIGDAQIELVAGEEMQAFEQRDVGGEPDREGGQQDMPGDHPGELQPRQENRIEFHDHPSPGRILECRVTT